MCCFLGCLVPALQIEATPATCKRVATAASATLDVALELVTWGMHLCWSISLDNLVFGFFYLHHCFSHLTFCAICFRSSRSSRSTSPCTRPGPRNRGTSATSAHQQAHIRRHHPCRRSLAWRERLADSRRCRANSAAVADIRHVFAVDVARGNGGVVSASGDAAAHAAVAVRSNECE